MEIPYQLSAYDNALACPDEEEPPEWWQAYDTACSEIGCSPVTHWESGEQGRSEAIEHLGQILDSVQSALEEM